MQADAAMSREERRGSAQRHLKTRSLDLTPIDAVEVEDSDSDSEDDEDLVADAIKSPCRL